MASEPHSARPQDRYDVAILGGGLAGLTLALQLKRTRPETSVFVAEKRKGPAPEAAFKVGESTLEIGAHYFARVLGLEDHIERDELPKFGVRFWFPAGDKSDIVRRAEYGPPFRAPLPTYQLDRGRFENELAKRNLGAGVDLFGGCRVEDVELRPGDEEHTVMASRDGQTFSVNARWVVGATGRASLIRRKLRLEKQVTHHINSAWFRLQGGLDIEEWSDDPDWHARMSERGLRRLSTNHLMDKGYWVWIIPLASGNASIGIVADPRVHPLEQFNTLERALEWLRDNEPQIAAVLDQRRDQVVDFLKVEHYSHGTERMYSPDRWCLTGDAGVFIDPLFSPGSDFIGICNSLVTNLITSDFEDKPVPERVEFSNDFFLRYFEAWLSQYEDLYPMFDDVPLLVVKFAWYRANYFTIPVLLFYANKLGDADFLRTVEQEMNRFIRLIPRVERLIRDWHDLDPQEWRHGGTLVKPPEFTAMRGEIVPELVALRNGDIPDDDRLAARVRQLILLLEATAVITFHEAVRSLPEHDVDTEARINPHAISLRPDRWEEEGLFDDRGMTLAEAGEVAGGFQESLRGHLELSGQPVV